MHFDAIAERAGRRNILQKRLVNIKAQRLFRRIERFEFDDCAVGDELFYRKF
jgi:hypothetical protein